MKRRLNILYKLLANVTRVISFVPKPRNIPFRGTRKFLCQGAFVIPTKHSAHAGFFASSILFIEWHACFHIRSRFFPWFYPRMLQHYLRSRATLRNPQPNMRPRGETTLEFFSFFFFFVRPTIQLYGFQTVDVDTPPRILHFGSGIRGRQKKVLLTKGPRSKLDSRRVLGMYA